MIYASVLEAQFEYNRALETYKEGSNIGKLSLGPRWWFSSFACLIPGSTLQQTSRSMMFYDSHTKDSNVEIIIM